MSRYAIGKIPSNSAITIIDVGDKKDNELLGIFKEMGVEEWYLCSSKATTIRKAFKEGRRKGFIKKNSDANALSRRRPDEPKP